MHLTLKTIEKLEALLEEADEYVDCANKAGEDQALRSAYMDLARCHFEGYEKLSQAAERTFDRKRQTMPEAEVYKEMCDWHKAKFAERAAKVKMKMEHAR